MKSDLKLAMVITIISLSFIFINLSMLYNANASTIGQNSDSTLMIISSYGGSKEITVFVGTDQTPNIDHVLTARIALDYITYDYIIASETGSYHEHEWLLEYVTYHWDTHNETSSDRSYAYLTDGWRWVHKNFIVPDTIIDYYIKIVINSDTTSSVIITKTVISQP